MVKCIIGRVESSSTTCACGKLNGDEMIGKKCKECVTEVKDVVVMRVDEEEVIQDEKR